MRCRVSNQNHKMASLIIADAVKRNGMLELILLVAAARPSAIVNAARDSRKESDTWYAYQDAGANRPNESTF